MSEYPPLLDEDILIAFLRARLDEDEAESASFAGPPSLRDRQRREVKAKRVILNEWLNLRDPDHWPEHPAIASARFASQAAAAVYSDHPDYREEWRR